jgi:pyruvate, water dikinase
VMDAIAEVYASVFGPDPIEYRSEKGLLDVHEEMGILLQEVVGTRVGKYFFPSWAGVAFSNNEFRWSPRIRREDGLVRLVPGLGTRAVDRVGDDYPVLVAPGQPGLRVNVTKEEVVRYAPRFVDVINLESRKFETISVADLLAECGSEIPGFRQIVSVCDQDGIHRPLLLDVLEKTGQLIVTFDGLVGGTPFLQQMRTILRVLREKMGCPVDIEFASDGKELYLLQCRPQSFSEDALPVPVPRDVAPEKVLFSAHKYVSNGRVPDLTHVVYVDPDRYAALPDAEALRRVGRAVSRLNKVLPKRKFILIGPGRWGSRGDIKLGVNVTYSDINNTAALVEVARKKGNYVPDLSFGTHFFQDLVEASIRYLPLFPDDGGNLFHEKFLQEAPDVFASLVPEFADLEGVVRAIDVPAATGGQVLRLYLNAEQEEAAAIFGPPGQGADRPAVESRKRILEPHGDDHARWRLRMAERVAAEADAQRFGILGIYVFGSTKNGTAGPDADVDLLVHFRGTPEMRHDLEIWMEGWSLCLTEANFLRTGIRVERILDVEIVTDEEIRRQTGHAGKIGAVTDAARPLLLKKKTAEGAN